MTRSGDLDLYILSVLPGGLACAPEGARSWPPPLAPSWARDGAAAAVRPGDEQRPERAGGGRPWRASRTPAPAPGGLGRSRSRSMAPRLPLAADDGRRSRRRVPKHDLSSSQLLAERRVPRSTSSCLASFMHVIYYWIGPELEPDTANKNKEPEQPASRSTTKSISYQKTTNARSPLSLSLCRIWDLLAPVHPIQGASVRTLPAQRLSEHPTESGLRASTPATGTRCPGCCPRRLGRRPCRQPLPTRIPCATIRSTFVTFS